METPLDGAFVAIPDENIDMRHVKRLSADDYQYFNSGILLFNLKNGATRVFSNIHSASAEIRDLINCPGASSTSGKPDPIPETPKTLELSSRSYDEDDA